MFIFLVCLRVSVLLALKEKSVLFILVLPLYKIKRTLKMIFKI
ncbi:hypothetical protein yfred0001_33530 [Yersinia frederiksenii ATCC 33641]|nr:hypothetical protein yfred0001_33530 [Yersinia frederiksenii ATCC 33641]